MCRGIIRLALLVIIGLFSIGTLAGCRSASPAEGPSGKAGPVLTAQTAADVVIVETGSPRLSRVRAVPSNIVLAPGETVGLSAIAFDQRGREIERATINWQVADQRVGTITPSGVFRAGFTKGTFADALVVTARAPADLGHGMVQAGATVTVAEFKGELQPATIRVFPDTAEVGPNQSLSLLALAVNTNGVAIPNMKFKWEILEPLAGSISREGRLTAGESAGIFPDAIRVTLEDRRDGGRGVISASLDIRVLDPSSIRRRISAIVLPQVISLRPEEGIRFTSMMLDKAGNQIAPAESRWEVLDPRVGVISEDGRFTAGDEPDIYRDAVRVSLTVPGIDKEIVATGTVIIVEVAPLPSPEAGQLTKVTIFPKRVVLSPGESTRVSIIGLDGDLQRVPGASVQWSLHPPKVGDVSQFVNVTAHDFPGTYEGAIRAEVILETESAPITKAVSATLIIRGPLATAEITPLVVHLAREEKFQFRAIAYDENRIVLPDVLFRWTVTDRTAGTIDSSGLFTAKGPVAVYEGAVQVEAVQRLPASSE